jgi:hypothetical protein
MRLRRSVTTLITHIFSFLFKLRGGRHLPAPPCVFPFLFMWCSAKFAFCCEHFFNTWTHIQVLSIPSISFCIFHPFVHPPTVPHAIYSHDNKGDGPRAVQKYLYILYIYFPTGWVSHYLLLLKFKSSTS